MGKPVRIDYAFEIDSLAAFKILCRTLYMDIVLDEDTDYYCYGGSVYKMVDGHDKLVDDRADLFIALRNVAVNFIPNLLFRSADYIYKSNDDEEEWW